MNGSFNCPGPVIGMRRRFVCGTIRNVIRADTQGCCDADMDAMLDAAAFEMDFAQRKAIRADIQRRAVEGVVLIWMPEDCTTTVWSDRIADPPQTAFGPPAPSMVVETVE